MSAKQKETPVKEKAFSEMSPLEVEAQVSAEERMAAVQSFREHVQTKYYSMSQDNINIGNAWMEENKLPYCSGEQEK